MKSVIADLNFLFAHREPANAAGRSVLRLLAKRILRLPGLLRLLWRAHRLRSRGAQVGTAVALGGLKVNGPAGHLAIGSFSALGAVEVATHDRVTIGRCVVISDGAKLLSGSHDLRSSDFKLVKAPIVIGDYAWVCTNALILPGVTIGRGAVVAAGAVVSRSVPDYALAVGNPAQIVTDRRSRELNYMPSALVAPYEAWIGKHRIAALGAELSCGS
jgi:maltose O-acetyltransferase